MMLSFNSSASLWVAFIWQIIKFRAFDQQSYQHDYNTVFIQVCTVVLIICKERYRYHSQTLPIHGNKQNYIYIYIQVPIHILFSYNVQSIQELVIKTRCTVLLCNHHFIKVSVSTQARCVSTLTPVWTNTPSSKASCYTEDCFVELVSTAISITNEGLLTPLKGG